MLPCREQNSRITEIQKNPEATTSDRADAKRLLDSHDECTMKRNKKQISETSMREIELRKHWQEMVRKLSSAWWACDKVEQYNVQDSQKLHKHALKTQSKK